ncbi:hypothetical protein GGF37_001742 [Kickxella alabastrina]|nr:hypothetical protein GGF37_001742 [Kickxella alabastrina]
MVFPTIAKLDPALKNINLTVNPDGRTGIVGRTSAGKSTLVKSMFRLAHSSASDYIVIDGQGIARFGVGDLRSKLCVIPQASTMLKGDV